MKLDFWPIFSISTHYVHAHFTRVKTVYESHTCDWKGTQVRVLKIFYLAVITTIKIDKINN